MSPSGRRSRPVRASIVALAAGLAGVGISVVDALPAAAAAGAGPRPVVLVLVPDLTWANAPPALDRFAKASLSMRTAEALAEGADTYVTLGKGRRSSRLEGDRGVGRVERLPEGGLRLADWDALQEHDRSLHYGGALGTVGEALRVGSRRWALASDDEAAAAAAATAEGTVPVAYAATAAGIQQALGDQPDALFVVVPPADVSSVLLLLDGRCTVVASASTPSGSRHLGVLATASACGLGAGGLASPSTHHAHLATLPDVSATFLDLVGLPVPSSVAGGVVTRAAAVSREALVERDRRTWTADRTRTGFVWLFVLLHAAGALAVILRRRARAVVCPALLAIPAASLLMMLAPWWRGGVVAGLLVGGGIAAVIGGVGAFVARHDTPLGIGLLAAFTATVVAVDALFASPLQIDAPFGNSPVVAGRFFGVGNIGSGFLVAGLLVAGGLAIERWGRQAVPWLVAAVAVAVVAGGAPVFGADAGGVLFAVPAYGLLLLGAVRERVTARHVLLLAGLAIVALAVFALVDLARGAGSQTHLARSVGDEGLRDEVVRKASRAVQTVKAPMANIVVVAAAALAFTRYSPGPRRSVRITAYAVVVAAVLGSVLNDSGVNVAAAVLAVAWPAGVMIAAREPKGVPA